MALAGAKLCFSYEQIHASIAATAARIQEEFEPTLVLAIGGGGWIPARILRTHLRKASGAQRSLPMHAIGLSLYEHEDVATDVSQRAVRKTQWLSYGSGPGAVQLQGQHVLIVDEVDDSRKTLSYAVRELQADIAAERAAWAAAQHAAPATPGCASPAGSPPDSPPSSPMACVSSSPAATPPAASGLRTGAAAAPADAAVAASGWVEPRVAVFVIHNKLKPKQAQLPADLLAWTYFTAGDIEDAWVCYPWDADDIFEHTRLAHSPGSATQALLHSIGSLHAAAAAQPTQCAAAMCVT